jgi:hypothetical protein
MHSRADPLPSPFFFAASGRGPIRRGGIGPRFGHPSMSLAG